VKVVEIGDEQSTCVIEWGAPQAHGGATAPPAKERWPKSLRVFRAAMKTALTEGKMIAPFGAEGPTVRAVPEAAVRQEFMARYPAAADAKQKAFKRAIKAALVVDLIASRELQGVDHLWLTDSKDEQDTHTDRPDTP
jgi:hypothetical protein